MDTVRAAVAGDTANIYNGTATISTADSAGFVNLGSGGTTGTINQASGSLTTTGAGNTLILGVDTNAASTGIYNLTGTGTLTASGPETIGYASTGTFTQNGATTSNTIGTTPAPARLMLGETSTGNGTYNLYLGSLTVSAKESVGSAGTGHFVQTGGTNTINGLGGLILGETSTGNGTFDLSGTGHIITSYESIGASGTGLFTQNGGTNTVQQIGTNPGRLVLGETSTGNGTYNFQSGAITLSGGETIGLLGTGVFTQTGGTNTVNGINGLALGDSGVPASGHGTYNLDGGTLSLKNLYKGTGTGLFSFGGGTLQALQPFTTTLDMQVKDLTNAIVDTNGQNVTFSGALSDTNAGTTGGLTKTGGLGTLTLTGTNTYKGVTTIDPGAGTLQIGNGSTTGTLGTGDVHDNANLTFNRSDPISVGNAISGSGSLTQAGGGTTTLTANNSYGNTTINAGALQVGNGSTTGTLGSGTVLDDANLTFNRSNTISVGNAISGTGTLTQAGGGTTTLTNANNYNGLTAVNTGTLLVNGSLFSTGLVEAS